jgi:predicted nucleotidyltransferase component of viral defense system
MSTPKDFYRNSLYPFQDEVLSSVQRADVNFYLTGGTVLSRVYLNHRYSDDLDFFVNSAADFKDQVKKAVNQLNTDGIVLEIGATADTFARLNAEKNGVLLKIDFVNDVPFHYGEIERHDVYYRIDNWKNILSNKICALGRLEAKDVADIMFLSSRYHFNWEEIIEESRKKDLWVEPLDVSKLIGDFPLERFDTIKWIHPVDKNYAKGSLEKIQKDIFYGSYNSLCEL